MRDTTESLCAPVLEGFDIQPLIDFESVGDGATKAFDTTVLFLELPDELKQSLREFSFELTAG